MNWHDIQEENYDVFKRVWERKVGEKVEVLTIGGITSWPTILKNFLLEVEDVN